MRIAVFTDTYLPTVDGVVNSIVNTRRALVKMGHEIMIVAPGDRTGNAPDMENVLFCRSRQLRRYPGYRLALLPTKGEMDFIRRRGAQLIHSHGIGPMGIKGMWAARELGLPMVLTFHTMVQDAIPHYTPWRSDSAVVNRLFSLYLRSFLHRCQAVVTPTRAVMEELARIAPRMKSRAIVPSGVDVETFRPDLDGESIRERYRCEDGRLILHVGRISPEKDIGFLIKNFPELREMLPGAKLIIVGSGPALPECRRMIDRMGLEDDVVLTGFVPDEELALHYAAADALATASKFETQGLSVLEAMACGKPVAAVNFRAFPEYISDGMNGFLFEPGNVESFCDAVVGAVQAGQGLRRRARETAEGFSVERCAQGLVSVYGETLA